MKNTADVTGGKPIAVFLQAVSGADVMHLINSYNKIKILATIDAP
jgi:hypothetical protein